MYNECFGVVWGGLECFGVNSRSLRKVFVGPAVFKHKRCNHAASTEKKKTVSKSMLLYLNAVLALCLFTIISYVFCTRWLDSAFANFQNAVNVSCKQVVGDRSQLAMYLAPYSLL